MGQRDSASFLQVVQGYATPLHAVPRLGADLSVDLFVKRDDVFPFVGGGNKARKMAGILAGRELNEYDCLVTSGGTQSNHARVAVLMAAQLGYACRLVLHGRGGSHRDHIGNFLLMQLAGAEITIVEPAQIDQTVTRVMEDSAGRGQRPLLVPGGAHCVSGAWAYVEAMREVSRQCSELRWQPETIVLATGTGTTQAGIQAGVDELKWNCRVLGISIARRNPRGKDICQRAYCEVARYGGITYKDDGVTFLDDWVGDGYECASPDVLSAVVRAARIEGLVVDPTYSGKALAALIDLRRKNVIRAGERVLFWHTGSMLNLVASNYRAALVSA